MGFPFIFTAFVPLSNLASGWFATARSQLGRARVGRGGLRCLPGGQSGDWPPLGAAGGAGSTGLALPGGTGSGRGPGGALVRRSRLFARVSAPLSPPGLLFARVTVPGACAPSVARFRPFSFCPFKPVRVGSVVRFGLFALLVSWLSWCRGDLAALAPVWSCRSWLLLVVLVLLVGWSGLVLAWRVVVSWCPVLWRISS